MTTELPLDSNAWPALAQDQTTPPEVLWELWRQSQLYQKESYHQTLDNLAANPNIPTRLLIECIRTRPGVIAQNPLFPIQILTDPKLLPQWVKSYLTQKSEHFAPHLKAVLNALAEMKFPDLLIDGMREQLRCDRKYDTESRFVHIWMMRLLIPILRDCLTNPARYLDVETFRSPIQQELLQLPVTERVLVAMSLERNQIVHATYPHLPEVSEDVFVTWMRYGETHPDQTIYECRVLFALWFERFLTANELHAMRDRGLVYDSWLWLRTQNFRDHALKETFSRADAGNRPGTQFLTHASRLVHGCMPTRFYLATGIAPPTYREEFFAGLVADTDQYPERTEVIPWKWIVDSFLEESSQGPKLLFRQLRGPTSEDLNLLPRSNPQRRTFLEVLGRRIGCDADFANTVERRIQAILLLEDISDVEPVFRDYAGKNIPEKIIHEICYSTTSFTWSESEQGIRWQSASNAGMTVHCKFFRSHQDGIWEQTLVIPPEKYLLFYAFLIRHQVNQSYEESTSVDLVSFDRHFLPST